jgi:glycosyltransferase involved in cell wall biosynthesis
VLTQLDKRMKSMRDAKPQMRIAVFLERMHGGGGFQQALSMAVSLARPGATAHDIVVFTQYEPTRQLLSKHGIDAVRFAQSGFRLIDKWSATVLGGAILRRLRRLGFRRLGRHLDALLDDHGIDLVILTECGEIAGRIGDHPFIVTVWDLYHRDHPDFREVFTDRVFERWERIYRATLTRALAVITSSPSGARRIASLYQVDPHRIIELPFLPSLAVRHHATGSGRSSIERVRRNYNLPARYVFYPANSTDDKNHLYVLEGMVDLQRRHGIVLHAVFCGFGMATGQTQVERQAQALGLTAQVHFLGRVPDDDIPALYEGAIALVMPSYLGPTNLPPLEAVTLGCPVIYSDLPEFREQMGDAALYCDLTDVSNLADHLAALIQNRRLRDRLLQAGNRLAAELAKIDYGERLKSVLDDYAYLRRRWSWPNESH